MIDSKLLLTQKQKLLLQKAREIYGGRNQVTVAAEECCELAKELLKAIRYDNFDDAVKHTKESVTEEVADVFIVLDHILNLYGLDSTDITPFIDKKLNRLEQWLKHSNSIEYTTELR